VNRTLVALLLLPAVALAAPVPKEGKDESKLYLTIGGKITRMNPDGTGQGVVCDKGTGHDDSLSPDGKWIVGVKRDNSKDRHFVMLREPGGKPKEAVQVSYTASVRWSADGKSLYGIDQHLRPSPKGGKVEAGRRCWRYVIATEQFTEMDIPKDYDLRRETPDGKGVVYEQTTGKQEVEPNVLMSKLQTVVSPLEKFEPKVVIPEEVNVSPVAAFPDGKRWLVIDITPYKRKVGVYTTGEKKPEWWGVKVGLPAFAVSPDGKRVAYTTRAEQEDSAVRKPDEYQLWVADGDGKNAKKLATFDDYVTHIDWR
jgi:dipeptidyl aminopeptidase/acylaminoacyl peptidase